MFSWKTVGSYHLHVTTIKYPPFIAYWTQITAIFTGAGNTYLTHPYPTLGTDKSHFHKKLMSASFYANRCDVNIVRKSQIDNWAAAWQNQQNDFCAQRRLRSALADQRIRCPYEEKVCLFVLRLYGLSKLRSCQASQLPINTVPGQA